MPPTHGRKPIRLPRDCYLGPHAYFITICTTRRRQIFLDTQAASGAITILKPLSRKNNFTLYAYCFMPDHCHFVLIGTNANSDLFSFLSSFKGATAKFLSTLGHPSPWQKSFHDHILRTSDALASATSYLLENPIRAGLTTTVSTYPFSGSSVLNLKNFHSPLTKFTPLWKSPSQNMAPDSDPG
jgi:putative transposase